MSLTPEIIHSVTEGKPHNEIVELKLNEKELTGLCDLSSLTSLRKVFLKKNHFKSLEGIQNCENVIHIDVSENEIQEIQPELTGMKKLTVFIANKNSISSLGGLSKCTWVKSIVLSENRFTEFPDFSVFPEINTITLSKNLLTEVTFSAALAKLTNLNLGNNEISVFPDLTGFTELTQLLLNGNKITAIPESIKSLEKLTHIEIAKNQIANYEDLQNITALKLKNLNISGNPIEGDKPDELKEKLCTEIPTICEYNSKRVKPKKSHYSTDHPKYMEKKEQTEKILRGKYGGDYKEVKERIKEEKRNAREAELQGKTAKQKSVRQIKKSIIRESAAKKWRNEIQKEEKPKQEKPKQEKQKQEKPKKEQKISVDPFFEVIQ
ncbi:Leucine Rich Repeat family protein [Trichomonas vaginalis G3]|uniref:Leucine Rich Repeat family protein n=1 Tax=Trichomonas vaginalis (strain ATCC PRA-98 / G3) TaxID=412133 RepID=A2EW26_TRIV3|nr:uncharacterized protein TVAGG3_0120820 [Trichomonas vaginalis G3]EAY03174.1 Leucine Rich Repeat family protein [Trichomonas vaginalis G3]KAI5545462.1 axoneme assembly [Trichomonas vaginalis G3]|eukprot:XP_001315397.1 hypothetical protein [Trichomonas vaginalis G3]